MNRAFVIEQPGTRGFSENATWLALERGCFALVEGFGGPRAGKWAADHICASIKEFMVREAGDLEATLPFVLKDAFSLEANIVLNAIIHANRELHRENQQRATHDRGGASVVLGLRHGDFLALASVGACQVWHARQSQWTEWVAPQTYQRLRDPRARGVRGIPLGALGIQAHLEPQIAELRLATGDRLWIGGSSWKSPIELNLGTHYDRSDKLQTALQATLAGTECVRSDTVVGMYLA